ncbi:L-threonine 3-dehydrogenase [Estrella lausannensis]|uniref:L-threonine 3-dehydrogenase n=1 Tax=Estrella lausannensis TaxID=483423 RepID=A0A0H5DPZ7_9BACT|nr:L-threonine 3-dehydrogenase [Estrella lausannensis]CRX38103.1 L-threonine 3-dehydrogenase [Estrella lausannensis]
MKALVKAKGEEGLWLQEVPEPKIKPHEVLVKIKKSAICGTDVHIYKWDEWAKKTIPVPMIVGHEFMGEIIEVGESVQGLSPGDRVCAEGHLTCGQCISCKTGKRYLCTSRKGIGVNTTGTFAEYAALPAENIFKLPSFVSDDVASIFDPFGNAVHTALTFNLTAEDVLITGAGPIGCMVTAIAKMAGARHIIVTDINEGRLQLAKQMGATHTVDVSKTSLQEAVKTLGISTGFTVGLEMSGSPVAFNDMLKAMRHGGQIALLGILPPGTVIDWDLVIFKLLAIKGIYGREGFSTWFQMTNLLESGLNIDPVITHRFPIEEFDHGFRLMKDGKSGKVILNWE